MKSILVVDSDAITASLTAKFLKNYAYNVTVAHDGKSALDRLNAPNFDLVLCDSMLTGMNGFDVLKIMRRCYIEVPFVFFSSCDDPATRLQAEHLDSLGFISKRKDFINLPHLLDQIFYPFLHAGTPVQGNLL